MIRLEIRKSRTSVNCGAATDNRSESRLVQSVPDQRKYGSIGAAFDASGTTTEASPATAITNTTRLMPVLP